MPQVVAFNYSQWQANFPPLAETPQGQATFYFTLACGYCDNSATSPIINLQTRENILLLLTAHVATLIGPTASGLVGRITNASEGSVSVAADMPSNPDTAWYNQTQYGALAWQMMAPWRQALYIPAPQTPLAAQSFPFALGMPFNGGFPWPR